MAGGGGGFSGLVGVSNRPMNSVRNVAAKVLALYVVCLVVCRRRTAARYIAQRSLRSVRSLGEFHSGC